MNKLKEKLLQTAKLKLGELIHTYQDTLASIDESKANETKSSAGDKFETGRAMLQAEEDKLKNHLSICQNQLQLLGQIKKDATHDTIQFGSLVETDINKLFISIPLGKIEMDGLSVYLISPQAPLAKVIIGKKAGDQITFNGRNFKIIDLS